MLKKSVALNVKPLTSRRSDYSNSVPIWLWIGVGLAFVVRLVVAWSPVTTSFALSVPDDAYYYFTIARNLAAGAGATFDGLAPTNGFHPLWLITITPMWLVAGASQTFPIHLALTLGALFDLATMMGIWHLAQSLTQRSALAALTVLVYAWNPYNLAASVNGLETSMGAMLFVWSLVVYWRLRLAVNVGWKDWLVMGGLWSLLLLARTDYLIIVLPCVLDLACRQRHNLRYTWVAGFGMLVWTPWLVWNWITFGSLIQVSGKAYPYYLHTLWEAEGHTFQQWLVQEARMAYGILANLSHLSGFDKLIVLLAFVSIGLVTVTWVERRRSTNPSLPNWIQLSGLLWPTLGALLLLLIHGLIRWMYTPWYFVPMSILIALWFGIFLRWVGARMAALAVIVGIAVVVFQIGQGVAVVRQGGMWAEQARTAQAFVAQRPCEKDEVIGVSDSGYYGYFLPCRVVNLDGVVNNLAFQAIQQGQFRAYLDDISLNRVYLNEIIAAVVALREGTVPSTPPFSGGR
jgi:hypothetical protein